MRTIAADKEYKEGSIKFMGKPLPAKSHLAVAKGISLVPEGRRIFPNLSVGENPMIGAYLRTVKSEIKHDIDGVMEISPRLSERKTQLAGTLSGGDHFMLPIGRLYELY